MRNLSSLTTRGVTMSTISMSTISMNAGAFQQPHLRITRRGRAVLTLLVAIPVAIGAAVMGVGAVGAAAGSHSSSATFEYVTVEPGESLWQVAEGVAPQADPREGVADILSLNNLSSGDVQAGQRLAIPAQYSH
jgi:hypothetical protein